LDTQSSKIAGALGGTQVRKQPKSQASSRVRTMNKKYQVTGMSREYSQKYIGG
jgi:hypothetical protein